MAELELIWYYAKNNDQLGPVSDRDIGRKILYIAKILDLLLRTHDISSGTLVWKEGMDNWKSMLEVKLKF